MVCRISLSIKSSPEEISLIKVFINDLSASILSPFPMRLINPPSPVLPKIPPLRSNSFYVIILLYCE